MKINTILKFTLFYLAGSSFVTASSTDTSAKSLFRAAADGDLREVQRLFSTLNPDEINIQNNDGIYSNIIQS